LPPSECLVIEDAPEGVRAAVAAGCSCLGLTSSFCSERLWEAGASWVVGSLGDLPADLSPRLASPTAV